MKRTFTYLKTFCVFSLVFIFAFKAHSQCHASFVAGQVGGTLIVNFTDSSTSPNTIISWSWNFGDGHSSTDQSLSHTYAAAGTYHVCLIIHDNTGCSSDVCHDIIVSGGTATCHPSFTYHQQANSLGVEFTDVSTSEGTITSWLWEFGDGATSDVENPTHTYTHDGTFNTCLTIHDNTGCSEHFCHDVIVTAVATACHANFNFHATQANPLTVEFSNTSTSSGTITSWHWEFGDGATSNDQNPHHTYAHDSTYHVCLTIQDNTGCTDHLCQDISVAGVPIGCHAGFNFHQTQANPLTIEFTNTSSSPNTVVSWLWDFGDGHISDQENPHHTYDHDGTYHVCLTMHDNQGCTNQYCHDVTIITTPVTCQAGFSFQIDSTGTVLFTNTSAGTTANTTYSWNFGDGTSSNDENPHHTYSVHDHYTICLFIHDQTTGCESHYCHTESYRHDDDDHGPLVPLSYFVNNDGTEMKGSGQYIINYPNPSNTTTTIQYELTNDANVKLDILDRAGRRLMQVINENQSEGQHTQIINVNTLDPGMYFLKMVVAGQSFNKKIIVIR